MKKPAKKSRDSKKEPPISRSDLRLEESRVAELLDIASRVFLANGFAAASMNEIARLSNSSKTTFYARFPTKEKLFIAIMERRMDTVLGEVTAPLPAESPIDIALKEYGTRFLRFALSDDQITLLRIVSMESVRFPELGERFYELGPKRGQTFLAGYLQEQIKLGHLVKMTRGRWRTFAESALRWTCPLDCPGSSDRNPNQRETAGTCCSGPEGLSTSLRDIRRR